MREFKVFKIRIKPLSYVSSEIFPHTIFGAICWAVRYLAGEKKVSELISLVKEKEILISSLMPIVNGDLYVFKPILKPGRIKIEDLKLQNSNEENRESQFRNFIKKFKKLSFVPFKILEDVSNGRIKNDKDLMIALGKSLREVSPFVSLALPHAKLNRFTNSTSEGGEFFFEESFFFKHDVYFLAAVKDENIINDVLKPTLKLLKDWGIGGNRSIGFGNFSFEIERENRFDKLVNGNGKKFITLSPVVATDRIDYEESFYDIKTYKGAIESGYQNFLWKPKIFYLKAGSLIKLRENSKFAGALIKPFKEIELYHYGLEFPIFIKESSDEIQTKGAYATSHR